MARTRLGFLAGPEVERRGARGSRLSTEGAFARADGAGALRSFWSITLPLLVPSIAVVLVLRTVEAFKVFDVIYIMTRGGPANGTQTVAYAYQPPNATTVPVAIAQFSGRHSVDFGLIAAGGVLASVPPVLLAMAFQRYVVSRLGSGAVKG